MPTYEYQYERADGTKVLVTKRDVPMSQSSEPIEVLDSDDGNHYLAERIISLVADMSASWDDDVRNSDLPPKNYTPEQVDADLAKRKGRKSARKKTSIS